jgi:hypothetical protein
MNVSSGGSKAILTASLMILLGLASCATQKPPLYHYDEAGARVMVKRIPLRMGANRLGRIDQVAYLPGESLNPKTLSEEQIEVHREYGQPEHVRKPFKSQRGETVDEWIYRRSNYLVQWIDGHKVYEGEVTDIERTLLTWGYPKSAAISTDETPIERQTWVYDDELEGSRHVFSFANGRLVGKEGSR